MVNPRRNPPYPCGSGLKFKQCCLKKRPISVNKPAEFSLDILPSNFLSQLPVWLARLLDFVIIPYLILFFAYEPNAANGWVVFLESGTYLSVINAIFHGQVLYRDVFLFFGPFSYWGPALAMFLFGKTLAVLRLYFLFGDILTYLTLYLLCRFVIRNRFLAYLAAVIIVIQVHNPFW